MRFRKLRPPPLPQPLTPQLAAQQLAEQGQALAAQQGLAAQQLAEQGKFLAAWQRQLESQHLQLERERAAHQAWRPLAYILDLALKLHFGQR